MIQKVCKDRDNKPCALHVVLFCSYSLPLQLYDIYTIAFMLTIDDLVSKLKKLSYRVLENGNQQPKAFG